MLTVLAGQIPGGPYSPPTPDFTWLAWCIIGFFALAGLGRLVTITSRRRPQRGRRR